MKEDTTGFRVKNLLFILYLRLTVCKFNLKEIIELPEI